jgi:tetrahydromethanopterin S-methyltransferase subunit B
MTVPETPPVLEKKRIQAHGEAIAELLNHYFEYTRLFAIEIIRILVVVHTGGLVAIAAFTGSIYGQGYKFTPSALAEVVRIVELFSMGFGFVIVYSMVSYQLSHDNLHKTMKAVKDYLETPMSGDTLAPLRDGRSQTSIILKTVFATAFLGLSFFALFWALLKFRNLIEGLALITNVIEKVPAPVTGQGSS